MDYSIRGLIKRVMILFGIGAVMFAIVIPLTYTGPKEYVWAYAELLGLIGIMMAIITITGILMRKTVDAWDAAKARQSRDARTRSEFHT